MQRGELHAYSTQGIRRMEEGDEGNVFSPDDDDDDDYEAKGRWVAFNRMRDTPFFGVV